MKFTNNFPFDSDASDGDFCLINMPVPKKIHSKDDVLQNAQNNEYFKQNEQMFMKLVDYVFAHQSSFARYMEKNQPELFAWVNLSTPKLNDPKFKLNTKIHWILMGMTDFPKCANADCKNKVGLDYNVVWSRGYVPYCSLKCGVRCSRDKCNDTRHQHASEDPEFLVNIDKKRKQTCLENYGNPTWNNRERAYETCLKHLGTRIPIANKDVFDRSMKTREKKYGKGNLMNVKKTAETCLRLYGHKSVWGNPEIHKKCIDKTIQLYGSPNPGNKYELDGFKFDSQPEVAYYIWLRDNKIEFTCKPKISFEYVHNEKTCHYYPDFIVEGQIVEIKGDHFFEDCDPSKKMINPFLKIQDGQAEAKHQCMISNNVKIITSKEYNFYLKYVEEKYGSEYLNSLKRTKS